MKQCKSSAAYDLPDYTRGEELLNTLSHLAGAVMSIGVLVLCLCRGGQVTQKVASWIYGLSMLTVYTVSALYHGTPPGPRKKFLQILDHCVIYLLIAGTYTPILLTRFTGPYPAIGWGLLAFEWSLAAIAITLTAIDMDRYTVFSMICYILLGWSIAFFFPQALRVLGPAGFGWLLAGGIAYTVGAVLYGIGNRVRWMHGVFHLFVIAGSLLQFAAVYGYCLS